MIKIFTSLSVYTHVVLQCSLLLLSSVVKVAPIFPWLEKKKKECLFKARFPSSGIYPAAGTGRHRAKYAEHMQSNQCTGVHINNFLEIVA